MTGTDSPPILVHLEALPKARHVRGVAWAACCPSHPDTTPSLSWTIGSDGRVLLQCRAGCATEDVVTAAGGTMADLFAPKVEPIKIKTNGAGGPSRPRRIVATYDYTDEAGVLLYQAVRYDPKDFRQRRPDGAGGWIANTEGVPRVLYHLPALVAAPGAPVVVVEGERDADRLAALGILATTCAMGAGKWRPEYADVLRGRVVRIIPDNDGPGRDHAATVAASLAGEDVGIVTLPDVPPKGDVSDWLDLDHGVDDLRALLNAAAADPADDGPSWMRETIEPDEEERPTRPDFRSAAMIAEPADVDAWLVEGVIRPASLLVMGAAESAGKSQAMRELAVRAATGSGLLFGHYAIPRPLRVMVLDEENGEAEEYRRETAILATLGLDRAALADYYRASFAGMVLTDAASQRWLDGQVETIKPDLMALDTGTSMIGDEWGGEMKAAMRYVRSLIVRYGCSVAVLVHLVKPPRDRRPNDPAHGSAMAHVMGQWTRVADSVALIADLGADRLRWEMRKKVPPSTLILAKRGGIFETVSVGEARKPSSDDRVLRAIGAGGTGPGDIGEALGLSSRTVSDAIGRLRRDGLIGAGYPYELTDSGRESLE